MIVPLPPSRSRRRLAAAAIALSLGLPAAGCGGSQDAGAGETQTVKQEVRTTRVEVVQGLGGNGGFDPSEIYKREAPGVVTVISVQRGITASGGRQGGLGSGFLVSASGEVATNAHVVTTGEGEDLKPADEVYVQLGDRNSVPAKIVGYDPNSDVALLKIDPAGLTITPLRLGSSANLTVGAPVAAIGSPFGEPQSLSVGVISAVDRTIASLTNFQISGAIQTDAAINHGNSGGPLVNAKGEVLGINSQIQTSGGGGEGVGFAVPIDTVKRSLAQLRAGGKATYAYLGVSTVALFPQLARRFDLAVDDGAWVQSVTPGGPAADAGIRAGNRRARFQAQQYDVGGDVIVAVAGQPIRGESDLARSVERLDSGQTVTVVVQRDGTRRDVRVKLGERPLGRAGTTP